MNNFKRGLWPFLFSAIFFIFSYNAAAAEKIKVVTTIPTLKEFVKQVGGDKVEVTSLLKGGEDLHTFDPKPSDTRAVSRADIVAKIGLGLDEWIDKVVTSSGNKKLSVLEVSSGVSVIANPGENPSHTHGNPHIWHDTENARIMIENIYQALIKNRPFDAAYLKTNRDAYIAKLEELNKELDAALSGLRDRRVVTYHPGWAYLLNRFKIQELFSIEKAPGREPSAKEIARTIDTIKRERIKLILGEPEAPRKIVDIIAKESGAAAVNLAPEIGTLPQAASYIDMMRYNVGEIAKGLKKR